MKTFDVVVVGARLAGAATAVPLAVRTVIAAADIRKRSRVDYTGRKTTARAEQVPDVVGRGIVGPHRIRRANLAEALGYLGRKTAAAATARAVPLAVRAVVAAAAITHSL